MKLLAAIVLLASLLGVVSGAPVRPRPAKAKHAETLSGGKRRPTSRSDALQSEKLKKGGKANVRRVVVKRMVRGHWVTVSRMVRTNPAPVIPQHPDTERMQQIQKALAERGFYKGEINGQWDGDTTEALKRFQTNRNLEADGKINSLSLIGLGLGPKHDSSMARATPTQINTPQ